MHTILTLPLETQPVWCSRCLTQDPILCREEKDDMKEEAQGYARMLTLTHGENWHKSRKQQCETWTSTIEAIKVDTETKSQFGILYHVYKQCQSL